LRSVGDSTQSPKEVKMLALFTKLVSKMSAILGGAVVCGRDLKSPGVQLQAQRQSIFHAQMT